MVVVHIEVTFTDGACSRVRYIKLSQIKLRIFKFKLFAQTYKGKYCMENKLNAIIVSASFFICLIYLKYCMEHIFYRLRDQTMVTHLTLKCVMVCLELALPLVFPF